MPKQKVIWLPLADVQVRSADEGPEGVIVGYASVWDVEYRIGYGVKERISRDAFADSLKTRNGVVLLCYQHDWDNPIGVARASIDDHGLRVEAEVFMDDSRARNIYRAAAAGALREWSIGFLPEEISTRSDEDTGQDVEEIVKGDLMETSIVVKGANPSTSMVETRSDADDEEPTADDLADVEEPTEEELLQLELDLLEENVERAWVREELAARLGV